MIYLTDDLIKRRCDVVKSGWSTKQVPSKGFFWCFNRRAIKKGGERKRKKKKKEEKRRMRKEEKGGEKKGRSHFINPNSKSSRQATPTMANYHRCGLMGRMRWLPSERACVDEWVPSWISSESYYQVSSHWHDGVIYFSWQHTSRTEWDDVYLLRSVGIKRWIVRTSMRRRAGTFLDIV